MRLRVASLRRRIKGDLRVEFVRQELTSYSGLELLRRYFALVGLHRRIRQVFSAYGLAGDYGCGRLVLLIIALLVVGARRLEHLRYLAHDPLVGRLCGLARIPSDRTVVNWLKQFTQETLQALITLNSTLLYEQIERLGLSRLTIDVDGTVVRTGGAVAWAFRGFNPHHRKDPSYYLLLAHLAQTGQILRLRNRVKAEDDCPQITDVRSPRFTDEVVGRRGQAEASVIISSAAVTDRRPRSPAFFFSRSR